MHYSYTSAILWITHVNTSINGLISTLFAPSNGDAADGTKTHPKQANKSCLLLKIYKKPHRELEIFCGKGNIIKLAKWIFRTNISLTNLTFDLLYFVWPGYNLKVSNVFKFACHWHHVTTCVICVMLTERRPIQLPNTPHGRADDNVTSSRDRWLQHTLTGNHTLNIFMSKMCMSVKLQTFSAL